MASARARPPARRPASAPARGRARAAALAVAAAPLAALLAAAAPASGEPGDLGAAPVAEAPYGGSALDRRQAEPVAPAERRAEPAPPDYGAADALDPDARAGGSRPLDAVAHPPRSRAPEARDRDAPAAIPPGALRLPRRPDVAAAADLSLAERLCRAERDLAHARRAGREAVIAYKRARRDEYPRGGRRALLVEQRALTTRRLERAQAVRDALAAEAEAEGLDLDDDPCRPRP